MTPRHGRRRSVPLRPLALAAGVITVVAGVGVGLAPDDTGTSPTASGHRTAADSAASSASPMAEEAASTPSSEAAAESRSPEPERTTAGPKPSRTATGRAGETPGERAKRGDGRGTPGEPAAQPAPDTDPAQAPDTVAGEVLRLVNQERSAVGCPSIEADTRLADAAQKYSDTMAAHDHFSHTGPDGSQVGDRVQRAGYEWSAVGENIARGGPWWTQVFGTGR